MPDTTPTHAEALARLEPVAWRVKDFADGWIIVQDPHAANGYAAGGHSVEPLYLAALVPPVQAGGLIERLADDADALSARTFKGIPGGFERLSADIRAIIAAQAAGGGWRPIETAPKDGTRFLAATHLSTAFPGLERLELTEPWRFAVTWWASEFESSWDEETEGAIYRGTWSAGRVGSWGYEQYFEETPSHWQPLPLPPGSGSDAPGAGEEERRTAQAGATTCPTCGTAHMACDPCPECAQAGPTDEDIERAAHAIASVDGVGSPLGFYPSGEPMRIATWDEFVPEQHRLWRAMARAALRAHPGRGDRG